MIVIPSGSSPSKRTAIRQGSGIKYPVTIKDNYGRSIRLAVSDVLVTRTMDLIRQYSDASNVMTALELADALQTEASAYLTQLAYNAVPDWFSAVDRYALGRFNTSIRNAMGIDAQSILDQEVYGTIRDATINNNVGLIRGLSGEHFQKIKEAIIADAHGTGFVGDAKSLAGRVQEIIGDTRTRASLIARDQTAKLNGQMLQARQEDAGITHYIWRTSGDSRVVGNPTGLYPKVSNSRIHGNHYERDGKLFAWNDPPPDGPPGFGINCRCISIPQIILNELNVMYADIAPQEVA